MFYETKTNSFSISTCTFPLHFPLHVHQYIELTHVIEGEIEMQIGSEKYSLLPGSFALAFPNIPHDYRTISGERDTQFNVINCYPNLLPLHQKQLLEKYPQMPVLAEDQIHEDILYAEKRLFELEPAQDTNYSLVSTLISLILCRLFPRMQLTDFKDTPPDLTCDIIAYISRHFPEDISLTTIANRFGIGKFALSRIFSNVLGISFTSYINSLRINYAKSLLTNTDLSIINVALESGYHNQQTFNRVFKELAGCTPKEYRNTHSGNDILLFS